MSQLTYPNATHTRFAHSLGALGIMAKVIHVAESNGFELTREQQENLRLAALLHDVGHYPYSHLMEGLDRVKLIEELIEGNGTERTQTKTIDKNRSPYPEHAELGSFIVNNQEDIIEAIGSKKRAKDIADIFTRSQAANPQLSKLITSSFDLDRLDYLLRDSYSAGVPYGNIDINYLLNSLRISQTGMIGILEKALPTAEQFLLARFFMHRTVYYHKTTFGLEEACRQLLRRIRDKNKYEIPTDGEGIKEIAKTRIKLSAFTDAYVDNIIQSAVDDEDEIISTLAKSIASRKPPKLLKEVLVLDERDRTEHPGAIFQQNCKFRLKGLADHYSIPLGQFLLCSLKPLTLEKRGDHLTVDDARSMPPEEEDELIKVFIGDDPEPVSLVDVKHSIISKCSNFSFRIFRLYVVYNEEKQEAINHLRKKVRDWDKPA